MKINGFVKSIGGVVCENYSMEDIEGAIKRVLDPGNMVITLVSKSEEILEDARKLGEVDLEEL